MKGLMDMMKQAKQLQEKMAEMQSTVAQITQTGISGAGLVSVTLDGKFSLTALKIDPSLMKEGDAEILEDLISAAHADAKAKVEQELQSKMQEMTGGLQLPPGLKLF